MGGCRWGGVGFTGFGAPGAPSLYVIMLAVCFCCPPPSIVIEAPAFHAIVWPASIATEALASSLKSLHLRLMVSFASMIRFLSTLVVRTFFAAWASW